MKDWLTKSLLVLVAVPLLLFYTNMGSFSLLSISTKSASGRGGKSSFSFFRNSKKSVKSQNQVSKPTSSQVLLEIENLFKKRGQGLFGAKGGDQIAMLHQKIMINTFSKETEQANCYSLQNKIPKLQTDFYQMKGQKLKKCAHRSTTTVSTMPFAM